MAEIFVDFKPQANGAADHASDQIIDEMDRALAPVPGIETSFSQPIRDNVLESISQIDGQIVIKVFGDDPAPLRNDEAQVPGARSSDVRGRGARRSSTAPARCRKLQIEIDRERAARYGLNVADIEDVIEIALGGKSGDGTLGRREAFRRRGAPRGRRARASTPSSASWSTRRRRTHPLGEVADVSDDERGSDEHQPRGWHGASRPSASSSTAATWAAS